jgi:hypothetical protein
MAFDPVVSDLVVTGVLVDSRHSAALTNMGDRNLTQGLGVIQNTAIHTTAVTTDDAQIIAALQTASRVPQQGQTPAAG